MVTNNSRNGIFRPVKFLARMVVVFQAGQAPTSATPPKSLHNVRLESSSTRSSFPADSSKSVPLARGNLVHPLMRVTNR